MAVDYSSLDQSIIAGLSEWMDWDANANLPIHDAELLFGWAKFLNWRIENHKELVGEWFWGDNENMSRIASDPEKMTLSLFLGVLIAAYRLGEGKSVDDSYLEGFREFINSLPDS